MVDKEPRVLLISPLPPPAGGIATWTKQYVNWAKMNSKSVEIVNTAIIGRRANKNNSKRILMDEFTRTKLIIKNLQRKIKEFEPTIIHLNTPCSTFGIIRDYLCANIVKRCGLPLIVHYRCNIEDQIKFNKVSSIFLNLLAKKANKNIVLNNSSKEYLVRKTKQESVLIANFIESSFIENQTKEINNEIKIISFVGHVQKSKGINELIEVSYSFPNITFKLAGPVANDIDSSNVPSNVVFMGEISKEGVKELLSESDIFLFLSHTEGFANALLEAMAQGLPIIATDVGANRDMIEDMGGVVVNVSNIDDIIDAINYIQEPLVRLGMSKWNKDKVKREYTTEKVMKELESIYFSVLNKN